jgi:hypothetical protein
MEQTIPFETTPSSGRRSRSVFVGLVGLIGTLAVGVGLIEVTRAASAVRATQWPVVPGTILSSEIRKETLILDVRTTGSLRRTPVERFYVTYAYMAGGVRYTGSRFDALTRAGANYPHRAQARYPRGAAVDIHVDPNDPAQAVLEAPWPIGVALVALVALPLGVLLLRWASREIIASRRSER